MDLYPVFALPYKTDFAAISEEFVILCKALPHSVLPITAGRTLHEHFAVPIRLLRIGGDVYDKSAAAIQFNAFKEKVLFTNAETVAFLTEDQGVVGCVAELNLRTGERRNSAENSMTEERLEKQRALTARNRLSDVACFLDFLQQPEADSIPMNSALRMLLPAMLPSPLPRECFVEACSERALLLAVYGPPWVVSLADTRTGQILRLQLDDALYAPSVAVVAAHSGRVFCAINRVVFAADFLSRCKSVTPLEEVARAVAWREAHPRVRRHLLASRAITTATGFVAAFRRRQPRHSNCVFTFMDWIPRPLRNFLPC